MAGSALAPADLFVVGANHRSSSVVLRDRLFVEDSAAAEFFAALRAAGIGQAIVLSTCDRVEVQGAHPDPESAGRIIVDEFARRSGMAVADLSDAFYIHSGQQAMRQIIAVTASLDSMMIGESQVLGQVRAGHRLARASNMTGPELESALQAAYGAAKRVRAETAIGQRPVSIASSAVQVARDVHGDLDRCSALLLGVGEMGETLAMRLRDAGLSRLVVAHPTSSRAEAVARRLECHHHAFENFAAALPSADIIITSLGAGSSLLTSEMMESALRKRRRRPMFLIDAAVPADVEPAVNRLDDLFLYDLDDLENVALAGRAYREAASRQAWAIVDDEVRAFIGRQQARQIAPALVALRQHFDEVRAEVLSAGEDDAEEATRRLINRLLHDPSEVLRQLAADPGGSAEADRLVRRLFRLQDRSFGFGDGDKENEE
ncbi:MAG: glutamyl-tRNA reductase [Alphaproteobacteria bacterium]|nr:glutamyl-tRNA reductase [Alphaproteobacteria bacterium]